MRLEAGRHFAYSPPHCLAQEHAMSIAQELDRLSQLHREGQLSNDEFSRAKARVLNGAGAASSLAAGLNSLSRSRDDRWLGGVCGGLAKVSGLAPWLWRALFVLLVPMAGSGVLVYGLLWFFLPVAPPAGAPAIGHSPGQ
jgi:phage shock protein C